MKISAWSIRHPIAPVILFLILTIGGLLAFSKLGVDENPDIDIPIVSISVTQIGAAPSELETQVTRLVEDAVSGVGNVEHITSTVTEGISSTAIEFTLGIDSDRAVNDVRDAITRIRQDLPADILEPNVSRLDFTGGAFATYTVSNPNLSVEELSWLVDNDISRKLLSLSGVGQVQRSGGVDRQITVFLDRSRIESVGLTVDQVNSQLRASNIDLPGGRGELGQSEQSIRTLGSRRTLESLQALPITLPGGSSVRLDSLASVKDGTTEPRQRALLDGKQVVSFSLVRSTGASMLAVQKEATRALDAMQKTGDLPEGTKIEMIRTRAFFVEQSYLASIEHLCLGALLAMIVIWVALRDFRAAAISAVAMPLSMIPTFLVMKALGYTLNNMSLLGLALVIGILVDDAIVEVENIVRHIQGGKTPWRAALEASDEIGIAVIGTTFSIIAVFVPVAFMGGIPGQFFKQFGLTVSVAVFFSLLVARLITPVMCAYFLNAPPHDEGKGWLMRLYDKALRWALRNRLATALLAVIFFVFGLALFPLMPQSLVPQVDRGELTLSLEMEPGTRLDRTTEVAREISKVIQKEPGVRTVFSAIGSPTTGGGPGSKGSAGGVNSATIYGVLLPRGDRELSQQALEDKLRPMLQNIPGARLRFGSLEGLSGSLTLLLASNDAKVLSDYSDTVVGAMRDISILYDVQSSAALARPELLVQPEEGRAAELGVTVASIARTAQLSTIGDQEQNQAKFDLSDRQIGIRVQLAPEDRADLQTLEQVKVPTQNGGSVPLRNVAKLGFGYGPSQIDRYDRQRQVSIKANMAKGVALGQALEAVRATEAYKKMPPEVREAPTGDVEIQKDIFEGFAFAMFAAVLLIYAVLVLLYSDFFHPLTIMLSLPLSIGGALVALVVCRESLGLYALIGIVMLMGLAIKNSILLVDYCLMAEAQGIPRDQAVLESGEARLRPILMTTVAMIAGMLPIAMGIGAGAEVRQAMAIAVIGGLITSTLLTLLVVPVVHTVIDDLERFVMRLGFSRFKAREEVEHPETAIRHDGGVGEDVDPK